MEHKGLDIQSPKLAAFPQDASEVVQVLHEEKPSCEFDYHQDIGTGTINIPKEYSIELASNFCK